ncbi:MAG: hypothetical protein RL354_794 [Planctomycetota bacterium]|jgi:hypothetical protein
MSSKMISLVALAVSAGCVSAAHANLVFMRGYVNGAQSQHTVLHGFAAIQDMASAVTANAHTSLSFSSNVAFTADYFFTDGTNYYRTSQTASGINQIYQYGSNLTNVLTGNVISTHNLSQTWSTNDDFWADSEGNFYRNNAVSGGNSAVTRYSSFANLLAGVGTAFNYGITYGFGDTFWSYGGKFYRTNTNNGSVTGIAEYASFQALLDRQVTTTYAASGSERDLFMTVPAPGAIALLGLGGLLARRRR